MRRPAGSSAARRRSRRAVAPPSARRGTTGRKAKPATHASCHLSDPGALSDPSPRFLPLRLSPSLREVLRSLARRRSCARRGVANALALLRLCPLQPTVPARDVASEQATRFRSVQHEREVAGPTHRRRARRLAPLPPRWSLCLLAASNAAAVRLHERSRFVFEGGRWFYVDGDFMEGTSGPFGARSSIQKSRIR